MQEKSCCDLVKLFEVYIQWHLQEVLLNYCAFRTETEERIIKMLENLIFILHRIKSLEFSM